MFTYNIVIVRYQVVKHRHFLHLKCLLINKQRYKLCQYWKSAECHFKHRRIYWTWIKIKPMERIITQVEIVSFKTKWLKPHKNTNILSHSGS